MNLALFFHLGGDVDMLSPFLNGPSPQDGVRRRIIVSRQLLATNARVTVALGQHGVKPDALVTVDQPPEKLEKVLKGCDVLLTSSETTLRPHRLAHQLTSQANEMGLTTCTLQHGVENVGLTYFDESQGPEVLFAAQHVLTWNGTARLSKIVAEETRAKVVDAGYTAVDDFVFGDWRARLALPGERPIVGVFENLHWIRFSDAYRAQFLDDLQAVVDAFPEVLFLLKPHPEGRWLTERFGGQAPRGRNLFVSDPADPLWKLVTAPYLMARLSGVITTPSKVALDAALAGTPCAVACYDGPYTHYGALAALTNVEEWRAFVSALGGAGSAADTLKRAGDAMVEETVSRRSSAQETLRLMEGLRA